MVTFISDNIKGWGTSTVFLTEDKPLVIASGTPKLPPFAENSPGISGFDLIGGKAKL